jgi:hypothetical protein|tara:strand:- start:325 stop:537 length:213 start_codon:yes stop_codon:yes gene_type:complete
MKSSPLVPSKALPQPDGILKKLSKEDAAIAAAAVKKKRSGKSKGKGKGKGKGRKKRKSASDFFLNVTGER